MNLEISVLKNKILVTDICRKVYLRYFLYWQFFDQLLDHSLNVAECLRCLSTVIFFVITNLQYNHLMILYAFVKLISHLVSSQNAFVERHFQALCTCIVVKLLLPE